MAGENRRGQEEAKKPLTLAELLPKILLWSFVALNGVVMVGGALGIYMVKVAYSRPAITEDGESLEYGKDRDLQEKQPVLYTFEPFTVNLDGHPRKILRTSIQLQMLNEDGYEEAVDLAPVARDTIVRIFNRKQLTDIETIQGKLFLKDEIMTAMNKMMKKGIVKEIYFGEFVVQ